MFTSTLISKGYKFSQGIVECACLVLKFGWGDQASHRPTQWHYQLTNYDYFGGNLHSICMC